MRAAPGEDRPRTPTFHANPGVVASARSHGPDAPRVRSESPDPQSRQEAASLCREHILLVLSRILQREPGDRPDPGALQSARPDLRLAARRLRTSKPSARTAMQGPVKGCAGVATVHQLRKNGAGNAPYREVVVCTTRSSCSHNPANIFRFRFITLASKWVGQSWRTEWLMEIGTKGATHSLGARFGLHGREKGGVERKDPCVTVAQATRMQGFCHTRRKQTRRIMPEDVGHNATRLICPLCAQRGPQKPEDVPRTVMWPGR